MIYQDHHQHPPPMRAHASNLCNYNLVFYTVYMKTPEAIEESNRTSKRKNEIIVVYMMEEQV